MPFCFYLEFYTLVLIFHENSNEIDIADFVIIL